MPAGADLLIRRVGDELKNRRCGDRRSRCSPQTSARSWTAAEVKRHAAFARTMRMENSSRFARTKAVSPLRSATALQDANAPFDDA